MRRELSLLAALGVLTACGAASTNHSSTQPTQTVSASTSTSASPSALVPTGAAELPLLVTTSPCTLLAEPDAKVILGVTLSRSTTLTRGGQVVGCQFFATQGRTTGSNETLPGPNQPILSFSSQTYPSALLANNALVAQAAKGPQEAQYNLPSGEIGAVYKVTFAPNDGPNNDWAFAFVIADRVVTIKTALINDSLSAREIGAAIEPKY